MHGLSQYYPRDFHNAAFVCGFEIVTGKGAVEARAFARQFQVRDL